MRLLYLLFLFSSLFAVSGLGLISDNFSDIGADGDITDYAVAMNTSLSSWFIYSILLALFVVIAVSINSWSGDLILSLNYAALVISVTGFMLTIISTTTGEVLLTFKQLLTFIIILTLGVIYKGVSDR